MNPLTLPTPIGDFEGLLRIDGEPDMRLIEGDQDCGPFRIACRKKIITAYELAPGYHVDEKWLVEMRVLALADTPAFSLAMSCENPQFDEWDVDGGEWLHAVTFEREDAMLTVGVRDGRWLAYYATEKKELPERFLKYAVKFWGLDWVELTSNGVLEKFPALFKGERVRFYWGLAWETNASKYNDSSTWYAAEHPLYEADDACLL